MSILTPEIEKLLNDFNKIKDKVEMTYEIKRAYQQLSAGFGDISMIDTLKNVISSVKSDKRGAKNDKKQGKSKGKARGK